MPSQMADAQRATYQTRGNNAANRLALLHIGFERYTIYRHEDRRESKVNKLDCNASSTCVCPRNAPVAAEYKATTLVIAVCVPY